MTCEHTNLFPTLWTIENHPALKRGVGTPVIWYTGTTQSPTVTFADMTATVLGQKLLIHVFMRKSYVVQANFFK